MEASLNSHHNTSADMGHKMLMMMIRILMMMMTRMMMVRIMKIDYMTAMGQNILMMMLKWK